MYQAVILLQEKDVDTCQDKVRQTVKKEVRVGRLKQASMPPEQNRSREAVALADGANLAHVADSHLVGPGS